MNEKINRFQQYKLPYDNAMMYFCLKNCFHQYMCFLQMEEPLLKLRTGYELKIMYLKKENIFRTYRDEMLMPFFDMELVDKGSGDDSEVVFWENCNDLPIIVLVDVYYLPHREEYHKYHASHAIFLENYNQKDNTVSITDWYHPYFYRGEMSKEEFLDARNSINPKDKNPFSGNPINNYWYQVNPENLKIDSVENILKNIKKIEGNKEDPERNFILTGGNALDKIIYVSETKLKDGEDIKKFCLYLHDQLFIWQRGTDLSRIFYESVKRDYPDLVSQKFLDFIDEGYNKFADINFYLMKASMSRTEKNLGSTIEILKQYRELHDKTFQ